VYALLFSGAGLSAGEISLLFTLWSVTTFVLEVPSGALADRVSRRHLLAVGGLLRVVGFALWLVWPTFLGFAAGFVLWGANIALVSGTWDALVYDELAALDARNRYTQIVGRTEVIGVLGALGATAVAAPLVAVGGFQAAGWTSVAISCVAALLPLTLPDGRPVRSADGTGFTGYLRTLRSGLSEAVHHRPVRRVLLAAALLTGFGAVDEYLPLLTESMGLSPAVVPLLLLAPSVALAVGAEMAGRVAEMSPRQAAVVAAAGAMTFAAGVLSGHPAGFLAIGAGYGAISCVSLITEARLQDAITGPRATVTSVSGFGTEVSAVMIFAGMGAGGGLVALPALLATTALPLLVLSAVLPRWIPPGVPATGAEPDTGR